MRKKEEEEEEQNDEEEREWEQTIKGGKSQHSFGTINFSQKKQLIPEFESSTFSSQVNTKVKIIVCVKNFI